MQSTIYGRLSPLWKRLCMVVLHLNIVIVLSELETMHTVKIILLLESMYLVDVKLVEVTQAQWWV